MDLKSIACDLVERMKEFTEDTLGVALTDEQESELYDVMEMELEDVAFGIMCSLNGGRC